MNFKSRIGLIRSLLIYNYKPFNKRRLIKFYSQFIEKGDLTFDIGAHTGNRSMSWLRIGAKVIAIEPQPILAGYMEKKIGGNSDFILLKKKENINLSDLRRSYSNLRNLISLISEVSNHIAFYYHKKLNTRLSLFLFLLPKTKKDVGKKSIRYRVSQLLMDIITFSTIHEFMRYYSTYFFRLMKKSLGKFN